MTHPQGQAVSRTRRAHPLRWLVFLALGLLLVLILALTLWPRFVGGLLGREGAWSDTGSDGAWSETQIIWDPGSPETPPAAQAQSPPEEPEPPETIRPSDELPAQSRVEAVEAPSSESGREDGPTAPAPYASAGGAPGTEATGGAAEGDASGSGSAAREGRRSPRILSQSWVRQELLDALDKSGSFEFRLRVEADGRVSSWTLERGFDCPPCLDEAERVIRSLRFAPGTLDGEPVACWVPYRIDFHGGRRR